MHRFRNHPVRHPLRALALWVALAPTWASAVGPPGDDLTRARTLLAGDQAAARAEVEALLGATDPASAALRQAVLRSAAELSSAPAWLAPGIIRLVQAPDTPDADRLAAISALGSIRSRDAVRALIDHARSVRPLADGRSAPSRDAAIDALIRATGHAEFGGDLNRWQLWFGQVQWLPEAEWRRELAESLAARADALAVERTRAVERLLEVIRRQYLELESMLDRSARIIECVRDDQAEVRRLGLSLAQQEVANARQLEPEVGDAAAALLEDPLADTRRAAAELVNILDPERQAPAIAAALRRETEPAVAAILLKAVARAPAPELIPLILSWLEAGPPANVPACDALDACERLAAARASRAPAIMPPETRGRAAAALRSWLADQPDTLPPSGLRLLCVLGDESDQRAVLGMLRSPEPARRWAAASAAAQLPFAVDALLEAAQADAALFPLAVQAVAAYRPTARGFAAILALPVNDAVQRRERLLALSQRLSHTELFRAALGTADASLREAMLARLLREPLAAQRLGSGAARTLKPDVIRGLLLLSDTRAELGQPAGALAALDALGPAAATINPRVLNTRRVPLLIWLERLDEAAEIDAPPEAWLDGLERCIMLGHAPRVAAMTEARFAGRLADREARRLVALRGRILPLGLP